MCNCTTLPDGNIILCDECAAAIQDMLEDCGAANTELVSPLTPSEYQGFKAVMADWQTDGGQA